MWFDAVSLASAQGSSSSGSSSACSSSSSSWSQSISELRFPLGAVSVSAAAFSLQPSARCARTASGLLRISNSSSESSRVESKAA